MAFYYPLPHVILCHFLCPNYGLYKLVFCTFGCLCKPCCEKGVRKGQKLHTDTHVLTAYTGKEEKILPAELVFNKGCS